MKKLKPFRILIFILLQLTIGAFLIILANLMLHSRFEVTFSDGVETYVPGSGLMSDSEFKSSELFTTLYTKQLQDVIAYCGVKNALEKDGSVYSDTVDVVKYSYWDTYNENYK